jgi:hypothetical protein
MEHRSGWSGLHYPKSLRKALGAGVVALAMLASVSLAQGDQVSQETREVTRRTPNG